jgi:hypothetical protein
MEPAQDRVQWRALVVAVLNLRVLLPESWLISKLDLREICCEDGKWMELAQDRVQWRALLLAVLNLRVLLSDCTMNQSLIKSIPNASNCGVLHSVLLNLLSMLIV